MPQNDAGIRGEDERISIPKSERPPVQGASWIDDAADGDILRIHVILRRRTAPGTAPVSYFPSGKKTRHLTLAELERFLGSSPEDCDLTIGFAREHGLETVAVQPAFRTIEFSGTTAAINAAFGVKLGHWRADRGTYQGYAGPIRVPARLSGIIEDVAGLDTRPVAASGGGLNFGNLNPLNTAGLYGFPPSTAAGQTIAILEFGGGYNYADLVFNWTAWGLSSPLPVPVNLSANGGSPVPVTIPPASATSEVNLDIVVVGAVAPGATINVYFCGQGFQGLVAGIQAAMLADSSVLSISWDPIEAAIPVPDIVIWHTQFMLASYLGMTILASSGDLSNLIGLPSFNIDNQVTYPASDPYVLGCGGTQFAKASNNLSLAAESTWQQSCGGVSEVFPIPIWQTVATPELFYNVLGPVPLPTGRGVPDISGYANGYNYIFDSANLNSGGPAAFGALGGTSAVAPLYAGLIARINAITGGRVGHLNPLLYAAASPSLVRQASDADNVSSFLPLDISWNNATGLGSLRGLNLLAAIAGTSNLAMVWKGIAGDQSFYGNLLGQGMWAPQRGIPEMRASYGPAIASGILPGPFPSAIVVCRGKTKEQIFWSGYDGVRWYPQQELAGAISAVSPTIGDYGIYWVDHNSQIQVTDVPDPTQPNLPHSTNPTGIYSGHAPAVCTLANIEPSTYVAWTALNGTINWRTYNDITGAWGHINVISSAQSEVRPAMAVVIDTSGSDPISYQNTVYLAFTNGGLVYWMVLGDDGVTWSAPQLVAGAFTNDPPTLAAWGNGLYLCWRDSGNGIYWSVFDGIEWSIPRNIPAIASSTAPYLSVSDTGLVLAWAGEPGDPTLYWSNSGAFSGKQWAWQQNIPGFGTSTSASLAILNGTVLMVWKGIADDDQIWFATQDGSQWSAQAPVTGATTPAAPACVGFGQNVLAVWQDSSGDQRIHQALWNGSSWSVFGSIPNFKTSASPALAIFNNKVVMVFKGASSQSIYYSTWDGTLESGGSPSWKTEKNINGIGTSGSPALAALGNRLVIAWKGIEGDQNIWYTQWDGSNFDPQSRIPFQGPNSDWSTTLDYIASSAGPALATVGQVVYMVWKGMNSDQGIYSAIWDGLSWSQPEPVTGVGTSSVPALCVVS